MSELFAQLPGFLLAHLQLKHAQELPSLRQPDLLEVLEIVREEGILDPRTYDAISGAYAYLPKSVTQFMDASTLSDAVLDAGFRDATRLPMTLGVCVCHRAVRA